MDSRFWSYVDKTDSCWIWRGIRFADGRGCFILAGKSLVAHRYLLQELGHVIGGVVFKHKCNNLSCVNPDHLYEATPGSSKVARNREQVIKDFWKKVYKTNSCWIYTGTKTKGGYGIFGWEGRQNYAHRFMMELQGHDIEGKQVLHRCDRPACVNPDHLYLGNDQDNANDRVDRDRQVKHKLTKEQVAEIKLRLRHGEMGRKIALNFNVTETLISYIKLGKVWNHVS